MVSKRQSRRKKKAIRKSFRKWLSGFAISKGAEPFIGRNVYLENKQSAQKDELLSHYKPHTLLRYRFGICTVFFGLFMLSFFSNPRIREKDLAYDTITLSDSPAYVEHTGRRHKHTEHWLELYAREYPERFYIRHPDYKYTDHDAIKSRLKRGNQVIIGHIGKEVYSLRQHDIIFMNLQKANEFRTKNKSIGYIFFPLGFILCLAGALVRKPVFIKPKQKKYKLPLGTLVALILLIVFISLISSTGLEYFTTSSQ